MKEHWKKKNSRHLEKRKLKLSSYYLTCENRFYKIGFICKIVLYSKIKNMVSKEKCRWDKIHIKKLDKLHSERRYISNPKYRIVKKIINNVSSYTLTSEEDCALSFSLDQHVPTKNNTNNIKTKLKVCSNTYRNIQRILIKNCRMN